MMELKPCPFCGGTTEMREKSEANSWTYLKNSKNEAFNEK
jgi:hypothetical protein